jgi:FkbM family methyltransferase
MSEFKLEWAEKHLGREPVGVLDVGTWDADDAIRFKRAWPKARVDAFEADPDAYEAILRGRRADASKVLVHHYAVCNHNRGVFFFPVSDAAHPIGMSGSLLPPTEKLKRDLPFLQLDRKPPVKVPSIRLDSFVARFDFPAIDLLHVDVQGAEALVIEGLGELRPGLIFLEIDEVGDTGHYRGAAPLAELRALLDRMGYVVQWDSGHDALHVHKLAGRDLKP